MIQTKRRTRWAILAGMLALALVAGPSGLAGTLAGVSVQDTQLLDASIEVQGLPPLTAPGAVVPLHWVTAGGAAVENTAVDWDIYSRRYTQEYDYRTGFQHSDSMGHFFDYIDVPIAAETIYLWPWAVIDGDIIDSPREYTVPTWRAVDAGSPNYVHDDLGRWWTADEGFIHHWVGFEGGTAHFVNQPIGNTDMSWMYQRQRVGVESYKCWLTDAVASMEIDVTLYFAELDQQVAGQRVFNVVLEPGTPEEVVISSVDIAAQVGWFDAYTISQTVTVRDYQLDIEFQPIVGEPVISGISCVGVQGYPQRESAQRIAYPEHDTYVVGGSNNWAADELRLGGQDRNHGGFMFFALQVPQGATINHAEILLTPSENAYHPMDLIIYAEDVDSSTDFRTGSSVPLRQRSSVGVPWNVTESWTAGRRVTSPDFAAAVQEVIDRPGWREWNALTVLLIADTPSMAGAPPREVWSHEGNYDERAQLIIQYTPRDQTEPPTPAPTLTFTPTPSNTPTPTMTFTPTATPTSTATPTPALDVYIPLVMLTKP